MFWKLLSLVCIALVSFCNGDANQTDASITVCEKCSPCWHIFSRNYGPCATAESGVQLFSTLQPVCIDTLILLIIMFLSIVTLIPTCLWLLYLWIKRCRNSEGKYIVNERYIM